jgi:tRNA pseudouridine38-40 synthase
MAAATKFFEGTHDFSAFMATGSNQKTTVRTVRSLEVEQMEPQMLRFTITADAYLYNMVRIIVGTLVYVGCGKISFEEIPQIISAGDRRRAGITAPPEGLFLKEIEYPKDAVGNLIV